MEQFTPAQKKDLKVLIKFVVTYCRAKHPGGDAMELPADLSGLFAKPVRLCADCAPVVAHAIDKRRTCPLDPKPTCKNCHIHCFSKEYRAKVREIMAFSGRRMIMRGRLDYLWHYFF